MIPSLCCRSCSISFGVGISGRKCTPLPWLPARWWRSKEAQYARIQTTQIHVGSSVRVGGQMYTVETLAGMSVTLVDVAGDRSEVPLHQLISNPTLELVASQPAPLPPSGVLDNLPDEVVEQVPWWERHVVEVLTGTPPNSGPGAAPRPEYDLATQTLRKRELAKLAELKVRAARSARRLCSGFGEDTTRAGCGRWLIVGSRAGLRRRAVQLLAAEHGADLNALFIGCFRRFWRLAHDRFSGNEKVVGPAAIRPVRSGGCRTSWRVDADRLNPLERPSSSGQRAGGPR